MKYLRKFETHSQYETYINGVGTVLPNVSYCADNMDVHYNPIYDESKFNHYIAIDDLPTTIDDITGEPVPYPYDVSETDYILNYYLPQDRNPNFSNKFKYVGEYEYDSETYYLWSPVVGDEEGGSLGYILTDRKTFEGLTVRDDVTSRFSPIFAVLNEDESTAYGREDMTMNIIFDEWFEPKGVETKFIATFQTTEENQTVRICGHASIFDKMNVDGVELTNYFGETYTFGDAGSHVIEYTIYDGVIPSMALHACAAKSLVLPRNTTIIGDEAFKGCDLASVTIPRGVTKIGQSAFSFNWALTSVTIPNSVTSIGYSAFENCSSLTNVTIPDSVTSIGHDAFGSCYNLTSVTIGNSATSIAGWAFEDCFNLSNVIIGSGVTSIGEGAFLRCKNLANIVIPSSVTSIDTNSFSGCYFVGSNFINNSSLDEVDNNYWGATILNSDTDGFVISGGTLYAYRGKSANVTIPDGVRSIGEGAFQYYASLTSVTIPDSVTSIGGSAFCRCSGLESITSLAETAPTIRDFTFEGVKSNGTLYVPSGSSGYNIWMSTGYWYLGWYNWTKVEQ